MAERRVLRMGNPLLRRVSEPVTEFATPELDALIEDLWDTMAARGGIGIAAPQVGVALRVVVFGDDGAGSLDPDPIPRTVLINPTIEAVDNSTEEGWEGCLSVPGMRGLVPRYRGIRFQGFDARQQPVEREVAGFHARVVQHECDHLDGILYPQRIRDMQSFGFEEEISLAGRLSEADC